MSNDIKIKTEQAKVDKTRDKSKNIIKKFFEDLKETNKVLKDKDFRRIVDEVEKGNLRFDDFNTQEKYNNQINIFKRSDEITSYLDNHITELQGYKINKGELGELFRDYIEGKINFQQVETSINELKGAKIIEFLNKNPEKFKYVTLEEQMQLIVEDAVKGKIDINTLEQMSNLEINHYLSQNYNIAFGIDNPQDIALYFNDPKLYIKNIVEKNGIPIKDKTITAEELFEKYKNLLNEKEVKTYNKLLENRRKYTDEERALIASFVYTNGPAMEAYLRNAVTDFGGHKIDGTNYEKMNDYMKMGLRSAQYNGLLPESIDVAVVEDILKSNDINDLVKKMDKIIEEAPPLNDDIIVVRNVDGLYLDGQQIANIQPGTIFNDKAFLSTSLDGKAFSGRKIQLDLEIPKGSKCAYIEDVGSVWTGYSQKEVLLPRDTSFQVSDLYTKDGIIHISAKMIAN